MLDLYPYFISLLLLLKAISTRLWQFQSLLFTTLENTLLAVGIGGNRANLLSRRNAISKRIEHYAKRKQKVGIQLFEWFPTVLHAKVAVQSHFLGNNTTQEKMFIHYKSI